MIEKKVKKKTNQAIQIVSNYLLDNHPNKAPSLQVSRSSQLYLMNRILEERSLMQFIKQSNNESE